MPTWPKASLAAAALLGAAALAAPPDPAATHEKSSGVGVVGGGFIAVTAVWVTPALTAHPYYAAWVPDPSRRARHRDVASMYTLFLVDVDNRSALRLEGYLAVNVRLAADGRELRPDLGAGVRARLDDLLPGPGPQTVPPRTALVVAAVFPPLPPGATSVTLVVPPLWLLWGPRQVGQTPAFELRFEPGRLAYPP